MTLSSVPPVAASLIATTDNILQIAPVSKRWKADAPSNLVFLHPTITKHALLIQIGLLRPSTIIVADQTIDADIIDQWRASHPFGDLCLVRRGTSLDKVRVDLCKSNGIQVVNTPGINAPHVAAYIAHWLTLSDLTAPHEVCVLGFGNVGKELVKLLLDQDPDVRIKVLVRQGRAPDRNEKVFCNSRVSFVVDWVEALEGASAVAICLSLNDASAHRIDRGLIQCMHRHARLVCVAKPDVFSDDALRTLAVVEGIQLVVDYGPATLDAFRTRTQLLGCSVDTWCNPATLTTHAATTEACNIDLDYAVSVQLSLTALSGIVRRQLAQSLAIPCQPAETGAPRVSIIGRGINGLLQAVMLRLANYQVTIYEGNKDPNGASHRFPARPYLAVECHRAGIELFEKLLADNPSLPPLFKGAAYDMELIPLMGEMEALLQRSGVQIQPRHLSSGEIAEFSREHVVVSTMGEGEEVSIVYCAAYYRIAAGGISQSLVGASLVQEIIQANQSLSVES